MASKVGQKRLAIPMKTKGRKHGFGSDHTFTLPIKETIHDNSMGASRCATLCVTMCPEGHEIMVKVVPVKHMGPAWMKPRRGGRKTVTITASCHCGFSKSHVGSNDVDTLDLARTLLICEHPTPETRPTQRVRLTDPDPVTVPAMVPTPVPVVEPTPVPFPASITVPITVPAPVAVPDDKLLNELNGSQFSTSWTDWLDQNWSSDEWGLGLTPT